MIPRGVTLKVPGLYLVKDTGNNASGGYLKNFRLEWGDALPMSVSFLQTVREPAEGSFTHSNVMFVHVALWPCTCRSDVYVHGQGWEVDLLITVSKFACHFHDNNFHHVSMFHFR